MYTVEDIDRARKELANAPVPDGMTREAFEMFNNLEIEMMENSVVEDYCCDQVDEEGLYEFATNAENAWLRQAEYDAESQLDLY